MEIDGASGIEAIDDEDDEPARGRPQRTTQANGVAPKIWTTKAANDLDSSDNADDASDVTSSGHEWDGGDDDEPDDQFDQEDDEEDIEMSDEGASQDELEGTSAQRSLLVSLRYAKVGSSPVPSDDLGGKKPVNNVTAVPALDAVPAKNVEMLDGMPPTTSYEATNAINHNPQPSRQTIPLQPRVPIQSVPSLAHQSLENAPQQLPPKPPPFTTMPSTTVNPPSQVSNSVAPVGVSETGPPSDYPPPEGAPPPTL